MSTGHTSLQSNSFPVCLSDYCHERVAVIHDRQLYLQYDSFIVDLVRIWQGMVSSALLAGIAQHVWQGLPPGVFGRVVSCTRRGRAEFMNGDGVSWGRTAGYG